MSAPPPVPGFAPGGGRPRPPYQPRKLACPHCGDQLEIKDENGQLAVCPSCASHLNVSAADAKVLRKAGGPSGLAQVFQLQIGDRFTYKKARYEVIGRLRFDEPEEPQPTCQYLLYNPRHGTLWLSEYDRHWDISRTSRVMPGKNARAMKKGDELTTYDGTKWLLAGKGTYQLTWVDGALPWMAKLKDRIDYAELIAADGSGETYEVEYPLSGTKEMEAGRGRLLSIEQVRQATGKDIASPDGPRENVHGVRTAYSKMKKAALLFMLLNLIALILVGFFGSTLLDQTFSPAELGVETLSEPFEVQSGSVLKIKMSAPLSNAWMSVDLGLVRDDGVEPAVVHITDDDIQYYSGREGGESWSEGSKSSTQFLLIEQTGTYRLLVRAVAGQGNAETATGSHLPLRIKVIGGVKRAVWLGLAAFGCLISLIVIFVQHQKWRIADDEDDDDD